MSEQESEQEVEKIFTRMASRFKPGALKRKISFYFSIGESAKWTVTADGSACNVEKGKQVDQADCVLKTSPKMFVRMVRDKYTPSMMDFMRGKIKSNNPMLLKELGAAFEL